MAEIAREILPVNLEDEMRKSYLDYAMSVIVGPRLARRPRRPEAGASARALRHARARQRLEPGLQEIGARRRRRHRQVSSARRRIGVRRHRAHGAGVLDALPAGRRPGKLRFRGRRSAGGDALHGSAHVEARRRAAGRHRQGNGRFRAELRRVRKRTRGPAGAHSESADQRLFGHRRRHGDQHPAAQSDRDHHRLHRADRKSGHHARAS